MMIRLPNLDEYENPFEMAEYLELHGTGEDLDERIDALTEPENRRAAREYGKDKIDYTFNGRYTERYYENYAKKIKEEYAKKAIRTVTQTNRVADYSSRFARERKNIDRSSTS